MRDGPEPHAEPTPEDEGRAAWTRALDVAALFCIDPIGTGGVVVRAGPGPVRAAWLDAVAALRPDAAPIRRMPHAITDDRLLGGLDLAGTLRAGRPVVDAGLLVEADGGVVVAAMAERMPAGTAARLVAVLDAGAVAVQRDGIARRTPTRFGVIALDEGVEEDERPADALADRLAFALNLDGVSPRHLNAASDTRAAIAAASARLATVTAPGEILRALCAAAAALGVGSLRAPILALRVARAAAARAGREVVDETDAALAAELVLAPRACAIAADAPDPPDAPPPEPPDMDEEGPSSDADTRADAPDAQTGELDEIVLESAKAAIPPELLAQLDGAVRLRRSGAGQGRAGAAVDSGRRGRPIGVRRGDPSGAARLSVIDTLRAAAPWRRVRGARRGERLPVRREDFRITRTKRPNESTCVFVVDASGSAALQRLAEAKGAVELLLAQSYVRRDQVALVAFRGRQAELALPATRSLLRAKRALAGLPGGGGTPLAAGLEAGAREADAARRKGRAPVLVVLTDARANIARDGAADRAQAEADAHAAARTVRAAEIPALLIDTAPRPGARAQALAEAMGAEYLPLPYADASAVSAAVQARAGRG